MGVETNTLPSHEIKVATVAPAVMEAMAEAEAEAFKSCWEKKFSKAAEPDK